MKKILSLIVLSILLINCESNEIDMPETSIVGTWNGRSIRFSGTAVSKLQGVPVTATIVGESYDLNFSYTLTENPNIAASEGVYSMEITTTILGQSQTEYQENIDFEFSGPWIQNGETLLLTFEGEEVIATITELNETAMTLEFTVEQIEEIDGTKVTLNINMTASFVR